MQSRIFPDNWQKFSVLGIYQSILNPAVLQIYKIAYSHNAVDVLGFQFQRRFVIYQRFQWEDNEKNCEVHQM